MTIYQLDKKCPKIDPSAYIAAEATIIGDVEIGADANVWPGAVARGDVEPIIVGARSSVQDNVVMHTDPGFPLRIGEDVTIGHQATLHGCTIGRGALVGMQAIVLNGAEIGEGSLVAAGALVTEGKVFPPNSLILGSPAKVARPLREDEIRNIQALAARYVERGKDYRQNLKPITR